MGPTADGSEGDLQGAIFVFSRAADGSWSAQGEMILATRNQARSFFGTAVSISGDWIVAGAASTATSAAGFVHFVNRIGSTWSIVGSEISPGSPHRLFGASVSISGTTAVVGAPPFSISSTDVGAAFTYTYDGSSWVADTAEAETANITYDVSLRAAAFEDGILENAEEWKREYPDWQAIEECTNYGPDVCLGYGLKYNSDGATNYYYLFKPGERSYEVGKGDYKYPPLSKIKVWKSTTTTTQSTATITTDTTSASTTTASSVDKLSPDTSSMHVV